MAEPITISHDPFGRFETVRLRVEPGPRGDEECAWCCKPGRFQYGTWRDGVATRPAMDDQLFCCIGCRRNYYND